MWQFEGSLPLSSFNCRIWSFEAAYRLPTLPGLRLVGDPHGDSTSEGLATGISSHPHCCPAWASLRGWVLVKVGQVFRGAALGGCGCGCGCL